MKLKEAFSKKTYRPQTVRTNTYYLLYNPENRLYLSYGTMGDYESGEPEIKWVRDALTAERFLLPIAKSTALRWTPEYPDEPTLVIHKASITVRVTDEIDPHAKP